MHDQELAQWIKYLIEVANMELGPGPRDEDIDLMISALQFIIQSPPPLAVDLALSKEGDVVPLDYDLVMSTKKVFF